MNELEKSDSNIESNGRKLKVLIDKLTDQMDLLSKNIAVISNFQNMSERIKDELSKLEGDFRVFKRDVEDLHRIVVTGNGKDSIEVRLDKIEDEFQNIKQTTAARSSYKQSLITLLNVLIAVAAIAISMWGMFK